MKKGKKQEWRTQMIFLLCAVIADCYVSFRLTFKICAAQTLVSYQFKYTDILPFFVATYNVRATVCFRRTFDIGLPQRFSDPSLERNIEDLSNHIY